MSCTGASRAIAKRSAALAFACVLVSVTACAGSAHQSTVQATATALTPTPTIEVRLRDILKGHSYGTVQTVTWDASQRRATVEDALGDHTDLSSLPKIDIFQIEQAIWTSQVHPQEVDVVVTGNQVDAHNEKRGVKVGEAHLTASRATALQWDKLDWRLAWNDKLYDYQWVNTAFYAARPQALHLPRQSLY